MIASTWKVKLCYYIYICLNEIRAEMYPQAVSLSQRANVADIPFWVTGFWIFVSQWKCRKVKQKRLKNIQLTSGITVPSILQRGSTWLRNCRESQGHCPGVYAFYYVFFQNKYVRTLFSHFSKSSIFFLKCKTYLQSTVLFFQHNFYINSLFHPLVNKLQIYNCTIISICIRT